MRRRPISHHLLQLLFTVALVGNIYPIVWLFINSLKTDKQLYDDPFNLSPEPLWKNYQDAWVSGNIGKFFLNSLFTSSASVLLIIVVATLASFFISRFEFAGKKFIYSLFVLGMLIPIHSTLVPLFIELRTLGLLNTRFALLFPYVAFNLPISILLLVSFMNTFPRDLEEASIMDGAGVMTIFGKVMVPLLRPVLVTVIVLAFIDTWNEFTFALVLISDANLKTLPLGIAGLSERFQQNYTLQMAAVMIVIIPTILFYLSLQKQLTEGMTAGAVKG